MNKSISLYVIVVFSAFSVISCVPGKKFRELQKTSRQNMIERDDFKTENIGLAMKNRELETKIAALEKEMAKLKQDLSLAETERNKAIEDLNILSERNNDLQNAQEDLIRGNVSETKKLLAELQTCPGGPQTKRGYTPAA